MLYVFMATLSNAVDSLYESRQALAQKLVTKLEFGVNQVSSLTSGSASNITIDNPKKLAVLIDLLDSLTKWTNTDVNTIITNNNLGI